MNENFVFSVFSKAQTEEMTQSRDLRAGLRKVMKFELDNEKDEILLDFYENLLKFCITSDFTLEKISCTMGISAYILKHSISEFVPVSTSAQTLQSLLKKHSIQRPPYSIKVYSSQEVSKIFDFFQDNYLKHYSLYSYGFTPHKDVIITTEKLYCASFPNTLALMEATEINPETIPELKDYLPRKVSTPELMPEIKVKETENEHKEENDPVNNLLNNELKAIKALIDEKMKKQDEEISNKIELLKK